MSEEDEAVIYLFIIIEWLILCFGCLGVFKNNDVSSQDTNHEYAEEECNND